MSAPAPPLSLETVGVELRGATAHVVLQRPATRNAWVPQLGQDLQAALRRCAEDDVRAVVVRGAGGGFSSGADLRADVPGSPSEQLEGHYHEVILGVRALPKPVVAAVHGAAAGIGCSLALSCDLVVMAESSFLLLAFVGVGLVPDGGASLLVPARAGAGRALEMALLGDRIGAEQALAWGLANRVVPDDDLEGEASRLADRLAAGPSDAYAGIKAELNASAYAGLSEQLRLEARLQDEAAAGPDHAEALTAFREKRPARFAR